MLGNFTLLGDPIVRAFTMAFDIDNQQMGLLARTGSNVTTFQITSGALFNMMSYLSLIFIGLYIAF